MTKNIALMLVSVLFGYMMVPQLVSAAKYARVYVVPKGVKNLNIISTYKGQEILNRTISVKSGQRFIVKSAD